MNYKISVIVPVYNVENYLEACLDSLVLQTLEDIEVIMINDGSTDQSGEIIDKYASRFSNFISVHKENKGLGHTRNCGIKLARGEYIAFLDSDDYVPSEGYKKLYEAAKYYDADIVLGKAVKFNSMESYEYDPIKGVYECTDYLTNIDIVPQLIHNGIVANKLHKREFVLNYDICFPESILYEDTFFSLKEYLLSNKTAVIPDTCYYWRIREDKNNLSISQTNSSLINLNDRLKINKMCDELIKELNPTEIVKKHWDFFKCRNLLASYSLMANKVPLFERQSFVNLLKTELKQFNDNILSMLDDELKLRFHAVINGYTESFSDVKELLKKKNEINTTSLLTYVNVNNGNIQLLPYDSKPLELTNQLFDVTESVPIIKGIDNIEFDCSIISIYGYAFKEFFEYLQDEFKYEVYFHHNGKEYELYTENMERRDLSYIYDGKYCFAGFKVTINILEILEHFNRNSIDKFELVLFIRFSNKKVSFETRMGRLNQLNKFINKPIKFKNMVVTIFENKNNNLNIRIEKANYITKLKVARKFLIRMKKNIYRLGRSEK
ncbi:glycosyltransferase [Paenibacillus campinasensis]|uniref:Glycosyltransferase n=1 Tax=Paenibacillus campinasensis TaxID=66347 RepID=A0ABW9T4Y4_9BACL|nr:glycosyltransferase [Paenibacillus campinasensis]MUG68378.1 glycosyltransferase [Paenibacillus campinasensis]